MPDLPQRSLSVHLLKADKERDTAVKKKASLSYRFFDVGNTRYHVYAKQLDSASPDWVEFFEQRVPNDFFGESDSPGALLFLSVDDRTYALTFGQGRHLLAPDCYEEQFGLRVVLNSVDKVRSIDKKTFDAISGHTRTQASGNTDVSQFGFDIEKDLLRAVTGKPDDNTLGVRLSGIDSLSALVSIDLQGLPSLLRRYKHQSEQTTYRERGFAFVDHMRAITAPELRNGLNRLLFENLESRIEQLQKHRLEQFGFELVIPDILDFSTTNGFRYSTNYNRFPLRHDIDINSFLAHKMASGGLPSLDNFYRSGIYGFNGDREITHTWSAFKCVIGEIDFNGDRYVLSDGNWYRVNRDYVTELDEDIARIPPYEQSLPLYNGGTEKDYNSRVASELDGFFNFDRQLLHPISRQSIEYCDLYTENLGFKDLIHIKHGTSSAVLSHLFAQGTTSAEVCAYYKVCQDQADEMVTEALGSARCSRPNRPTEVRTVYGIIRSRSGRLPFFSKVNLRRTCRDLHKARMQYALAEIDYDPKYLILSVPPKGRKA